jgi:hypothetical protein
MMPIGFKMTQELSNAIKGIKAQMLASNLLTKAEKNGFQLMLKRAPHMFCLTTGFATASSPSLIIAKYAV